MLIRVTGGREGIAEYLRSGVKAGRGWTRDQLDRRVVLAGDLDLVDSVIGAMRSKGERYLHVTMAYKEDHVTAADLHLAARAFRTFAMAAYEADEYTYYAEAHLPRIRSYLDHKGELVERKPHIHIVIPLVNLVSGARLDPLGNVRQTERYYDALQEVLNAKHGWGSPKENRRPNLAPGADMVSRLKGDVFSGPAKKRKQDILDRILEKDICTWNGFMEMLSEFGAVRVRNSGTPRMYAHVTPNDAARGYNLREQVFSPEFIELPGPVKRHRLTEKSPVRYEEVRPAKRPSVEYLRDLDYWYRRRAREIRWINSGHRRLFAAYKSANDQEKERILRERAERWRLKWRTPRITGSPNVGVSLLDKERDGEKRDIMPDISTVGLQDDHVVAQWLEVVGDARQAAKMDESESIARAKKELDAGALLTELERSHGLVRQKYQVIAAEDGSPRIVCGKRRLNVADFLTKELHLRWDQAAEILVTCHQRQLEQQRLQAQKSTERLMAPVTHGTGGASGKRPTSEWGTISERVARRKALRAKAAEAGPSEVDLPARPRAPAGPQGPGTLGGPVALLIFGRWQAPFAIEQPLRVWHDAEGMECVLEYTDRVEVLLCSDEFVRLALEAAIERFGKRLRCEGDPVFLETVVRVAVEAGIEVDFEDEALAAAYQELREQGSASWAPGM